MEGKVCLEKENRHVYGQSVDWEGMKLPEKGQRDGNPLGRLGRMILNTAEGRSALDARGDWREGSLEAKEER